jgi:methylated-DNA-protein-cysteine methyltransferase-like protein
MVRHCFSFTFKFLNIFALGHIAKLIGMPTYARHVGQGTSLHFIHDRDISYSSLIHLSTALKFLGPQDPANPIPWQRVLSSSGAISSRGPGTNGADLQRQALEAEGVEVTRGRTGDLRVDLHQFGWFPEPGTIELPELDQELEGDREE